MCTWPTLSSDCMKCNIYILKRNLNKPKIASYCFKETELCVATGITYSSTEIKIKQKGLPNNRQGVGNNQIFDFHFLN